MSHSESSKYEPFRTALNAAVEKIRGYYEQIADNDAYIMAMCMCLLEHYCLIFTLVVDSA